jgi:hypothetical protein
MQKGGLRTSALATTGTAEACDSTRPRCANTVPTWGATSHMTMACRTKRSNTAALAC